MRETEPNHITQGEKLEWTRSFCDRPAGLYTLQYRFRGVGTGFDADATADGDGFAVSVASDTTFAMSIGKYRWQAWVTEIADPTNKMMVAEGSCTVRRGFVDGTTGNIDLRSPAKVALDAIDAVMANAASNDQLEYEVSTPAGSRRVKRMSRTELVQVRKYYAGIVSRENAAERVRNGGKFGKPVNVRMYEQ